MQTQARPCRFIVLGAARTGSYYLLSLLSAHEKIKVYGELFNLDSLSPALLTEVLEDPIAYVRKRIDRELPAGKSAVGFKLFYDHLNADYFQKVVARGETAGVIGDRIDRLNELIDTKYSRDGLYERFGKTWDHLINDTGIRIIHLKRRNKLQSLVSLKTAYQNNEWMNYTGKTGDRPTIEVGYEECCRYFTRMEEYEDKHSRLFAAHDMLDLYYEDLVADKDAELGRVLDFLQLPSIPLFTRLHKQNAYPLNDVIVDYPVLKNMFDDTRWHMFFS